jgi:hypothetical protein
MESSKSSKFKENMNIVEEDLVDKDKDIFDHAISFELFEFQKQTNQSYRDKVVHYNTWESDLAKFLVPQIYHFQKFVVWCASNYIPSKRAIISATRSLLIELPPQSIVKMMRCPLNHDDEALNEFIYAKLFRELKPEERVTLL